MDISIFTYIDVLPISFAGWSKTTDNKQVIVIEGQNFDRAAKVLVNGISTEFEVMSSKLIVVTPTDSLKGQEIRSVVVHSSGGLDVTETSLLEISTKYSKKITGMNKLIQYLLKIYLQSANDMFGDFGGGILELLGSAYNVSSISSDLITRLQQTVAYIRRVQANVPELPLEEKLLIASIKNISFDDEALYVNISLDVLNQAGQKSVAAISGELGVNK